MRAQVYFEDRNTGGYWTGDKVWEPHSTLCFTCAVKRAVLIGAKIVMQSQEGRESYITCKDCQNTIEDEVSI